MVLTSGVECTPPGHPEFSPDSRSEFHAAAREVYKTSTNLTADQKIVAEYWADGAGATGTPPGHWIAIVGQLAVLGYQIPLQPPAPRDLHPGLHRPHLAAIHHDPALPDLYLRAFHAVGGGRRGPHRDVRDQGVQRH